MRNELTGPEKVKKIFTGRPEIMGQMLYEELFKLKDARKAKES
jgi:hypothetical protein